MVDTIDRNNEATVVNTTNRCLNRLLTLLFNFAYSSKLMSEMAGAIGKDADSKKYADIYLKIKKAFVKNI